MIPPRRGPWLLVTGPLGWPYCAVLMLQLVLVLVGVAAEVCGLVLACKEVVQRRADLGTDRSRLRRVTSSRATSWDVARPGTVQVEPDLRTPEEKRLAALETEVAALRDELTAEACARASVQEQAASAAQTVRTDLGRNVDEVRDLLHQVTAPNRRTWWSLGLLFGGLALQALAAVLGIATQMAQGPCPT